MIDIKKYYLFCMGEGYLDKRRYAEDVTHEKALTRIHQDIEEHRQTLTQGFSPPVFTAKTINPPFLNQPLPWFQRSIFMLLKPIQVVIVSIREFLHQFMHPNPMATGPKGSLLNHIVGQMMTFFFGFKKDKTQEKEQRHLEDFNDVEIWGRRVVESSSGSGFSGSQR